MIPLHTFDARSKCGGTGKSSLLNSEPGICRHRKIVHLCSTTTTTAAAAATGSLFTHAHTALLCFSATAGVLTVTCFTQALALRSCCETDIPRALPSIPAPAQTHDLNSFHAISRLCHTRLDDCTIRLHAHYLTALASVSQHARALAVRSFYAANSRPARPLLL